MVQSVPSDARPRSAVSGASGASAPVPGRRERKKRATTAAIREAALRLAVRHGVENVTVEQIANHADIHLRTFFNHFSCKEEAVVATAAAGAEALIAEFRARPATESVLRAIREAVLVVMDQSYAPSRDHIEALRLIRMAPSLLPQQLAVLATQEKALADAIAHRVGLATPAGTTSSPQQAQPAARPGAVYPAICAAAALAALRVSLDGWLDQASTTTVPPAVNDLRVEIDRAIAELATGLDWPASASG
jgi:AcrR family transcriptional regulator